MAWLFVPGVEVLSSDSILSCPSTTAAYVLLNGKPTRRPAFWRGWKKRPWARRLSGMTLPHSILAHGLDSWISSLWATRASPIHARGKSMAEVTRAISGLTEGGLFASLNRGLSGEKMLMTASPLILSTSRRTWKQTVTALRQESLARRKLARRILENVFSSWPNWPTPNTIDQKGGTRNGRGQTQLCHAVKNNWPTPAAAQAKQGQNSPDGIRGQTLVGAARGQNWATPTTVQSGPDFARKDRKGAGQDDLVTMTVKEALGLNFATPTAHDCKGKGRDCQLVTDLIHGRGRPGADVPNLHGKLPGLLNPDWEEQLMGWASGQSAFTCSEKELSLYLRRWRLWLFGKN